MLLTVNNYNLTSHTCSKSLSTENGLDPFIICRIPFFSRCVNFDQPTPDSVRYNITSNVHGLIIIKVHSRWTRTFPFNWTIFWVAILISYTRVSQWPNPHSCQCPVYQSTLTQVNVLNHNQSSNAIWSYSSWCNLLGILRHAPKLNSWLVFSPTKCPGANGLMQSIEPYGLIHTYVCIKQVWSCNAVFQMFNTREHG